VYLIINFTLALLNTHIVLYMIADKRSSCAEYGPLGVLSFQGSGACLITN
jgi:hypothetical protein